MQAIINLDLGVTLGNREKIQGDGDCRQLQIWVQGLTICDDFLILGLGNSDLIPGLQWLEKLGEALTNWKEQIMKF